MKKQDYIEILDEYLYHIIIVINYNHIIVT